MNGDMQLADAYLIRRQSAAKSEALDWLTAGTKPEEKPAAPVPHNPPATDKAGPLDTLGAMARDIGKGVIETPRAVYHGAIEAANEALDLAGAVGQWAEDATGLGGLEIGADGIRMLSAEQLAAKRVAGEGLADQRIPQVDEPKSVTGGIVEGAAQFLTGFGVANRALAGAKTAAALGQWGTSMAAGAMADAAVFDEHSTRLSNLVEEFPALKNPVTEYLAADPTDSVAEGRFKNALEGLGIGMVTHGVALGVKAIRSHMIARGVDAADALKAKKLPALDDFDVEVTTIDPTGATAKTTMKAKDALADIDHGITTMKAVLECLG